MINDVNPTFSLQFLKGSQQYEMHTYIRMYGFKLTPGGWGVTGNALQVRKLIQAEKHLSCVNNFNPSLFLSHETPLLLLQFEKIL